MEDSCSFAAPGSSASGSHEQRNEESVEGKNKCTACGMPVKGHLGQCGSAKCLYSLLSKVTSRVDELEQAGRARQEELESLQSLNSERQVALLQVRRTRSGRSGPDPTNFSLFCLFCLSRLCQGFKVKRNRALQVRRKEGPLSTRDCSGATRLSL